MNRFVFSCVAALVLCSYSLAESEDMFESETKSTTISGPVRQSRSLGVTCELPWRGLVGLGPIATFYPIPNLAVDAGFGLGGTGFKYGVRGRYVFLRGSASPFVGFGFMSGSGTGEVEMEIVDDSQNKVNFILSRSNFLQFTGGLDLVTKGGFMLVLAAGYAPLLNSENVVITSGEPTDLQEQVLDIAYGGGMSISVGLGYAFKIR